MQSQPISVLKFGSSVLTSEDVLPDAVHEIYRHLRRGRRVVAVVSAIGSTTDSLVSRAKALTVSPGPEAYAGLLATGEAQSVALLAIAIERAGITCRTLDARALGLRTTGPLLDAEPIAIHVNVIEDVLKRVSVLVVPGFVGADGSGATSLLGRGGSDLTALFIAHKIGAKTCRLLKDVDGIYNADPNETKTNVRRYTSLSWDDALAVGGPIVQPKALQFARQNTASFELAAANGSLGTQVGPGPTRLCESTKPITKGPLRVGLLGLGTVGLGVYQRLAAHPNLFEVVKIAVRDSTKSRDKAIGTDVLTTDPFEVIDADCDIIIEALGGTKPAAALILEALEKGCHVVTANKDVVAATQGRLERLAAKRGVFLAYSAAVGGGVPVLEMISSLAHGSRVVSVEGILNATTNFVLDRMGTGESIEDAVAAAQRSGFAEADPTEDLNGMDLVRKLCIIARVALSAEADPASVVVPDIRTIEPEHIRQVKKDGRVVRQIGSCRRAKSGVEVSVKMVAVGPAHAFASVQSEENIAVIGLDDGRTITIRGKGAGRWPTTEAVIADIFDIAHVLRHPAAEGIGIEDAASICTEEIAQ